VEKAANPLDAVSFPLSAESSETAMRALRAGIEERDLSVSDLRAEIFDLKEQNRKLASKLAKFTGEKAPAVAGSPGVTYPDVLKEEVRKRIETGAYTNAIALLEEMKTLLPEDTDVPRLLGVAFCRQGYFVEALRVIEPLVKRGRAPADVLLTLGVAYLGTGNLGRARNAFEKALDRDPLLSEAHFNLAQILIRLKPPEADLARRHYLIATQQGATRDSALETAIGQALMYEQARKLKR
jgi:tetratricopeptide (TPR) repeat protein